MSRYKNISTEEYVRELSLKAIGEIRSAVCDIDAMNENMLRDCLGYVDGICHAVQIVEEILTED